MLNSLKLKAKIVENGETITSVAQKIGIDVSTFHRKMANDTFFTKEADMIKKILNLSEEEATNIFFNQ